MVRQSRRITIEYCMIRGFNDSQPCAEALAKLLRNIKCNINLIEYNEHPGSKLLATTHKKILLFQEILENIGIETHTRFKRGKSINAACGQLGLLGDKQ